MSWLSRLRNALAPRRLDHDLEEEIADHLERRAAALGKNGVAPEEARRLSHLRFGNTTRLREESRSIRLWATLEGTLQDIRYAWRGMRKGPAFAAAAVLSLGLAIGANTAIYSIVDAAILRPLPVSKPDELFALSWPGISDPGEPAGEERPSFSYPEYLQYAAVTEPVARLALVTSPQRVEMQPANSDGPIERINRAYVSGKGFDLLGVGPAIGRLFGAEEDRVPGRRVAVLSYEYWQRRFGRDRAIIGREIVLDRDAFEVIGVAREGFFGVEPGKFVDVWVPGTTYETRALAAPDWHWLRIIGRLTPGNSREQVQARLQPSFYRFQVERMKGNPTIPVAIRKQFLQSVIRVRSAAEGVSNFREAFSRPLWIVAGIAAGILLIACANVASLLLARSTARATEIAMRISLGASRRRLVRQMLTESLMLSLMAGALGWLIARAVAPVMVRLLSTEDDPVQFALAIDTRVLLFCIAVSTASAVLFGLVPAWQASGAQPMRALRASAGLARKLRLGKLFVTIQVACAFCLVTAGAAFLFSLGNLLQVNPGFDAHNVAVLDLRVDSPKKRDDPLAINPSDRDEEARLRNLMFQLQSRVAAQPGVQAVASAPWPIFEGGGWSMQVLIPGKGPSEREEIFYNVSPGYFATLRTPLLAGRDFEARDSSMMDPIPVIVNESFARKYFERADVLGREFSYLGGSSQTRLLIIGEVADAYYYDLRKGADPIVYFPAQGNNGFTLYVRSPLRLGQVLRTVERDAHDLGSGMRVHEVTSMETIVGNTLLREKLLADVGGVFAFFGLLVAAIGLFGLLSYSVGRRTKEIGIRAALGARPAGIVSMVLKEMTGLMSGGVIIGLAGGLAVMMVFRSLLFGIRRADPEVVATAVGLFALTGLLAVSLPAHRAASVDPMLALREE